MSAFAKREKRRMEQRGRMEEELFVRVPLTKVEKNRQKGQARQVGALSQLADLGDEVADLVGNADKYQGSSALEALQKRRNLADITGEYDAKTPSRANVSGDGDLPTREDLGERRVKPHCRKESVNKYDVYILPAPYKNGSHAGGKAESRSWPGRVGRLRHEQGSSRGPSCRACVNVRVPFGTRCCADFGGRWAAQAKYRRKADALATMASMRDDDDDDDGGGAGEVRPPPPPPPNPLHLDDTALVRRNRSTEQSAALAVTMCASAPCQRDTRPP
eukprot:1182984-Prorocentrum_minimum.AAC.3